jgi:hypothetical protein
LIDCKHHHSPISQSKNQQVNKSTNQ